MVNDFFVGGNKQISFLIYEYGAKIVSVRLV